MKLSYFEQQEKERFTRLQPRFLTRRFKKTSTGGELIEAQKQFANELKAKYGISFAVDFHPFLGRKWTTTGWLYANPNWGRNLPEGNETCAGIVRDAYHRIAKYYMLGKVVPTGALWGESKLTATEFLSGLARLWRQGKVYPHVNRQGKAIYVTLRDSAKDN